MSSEQIKPGYKRTEVGVIPEDWSLLSIQELTSRVGDGLHGTPAYSNRGDYFFINGNNLNAGKISITLDTKSVDRSEFIKHQKPLNNRTLLMSINGSIGNLALFNAEQVILGKSVAYLNVNPKISRIFLYYTLQTSAINQQFFDGLTGSTIGNLGLKTIREAKIPLPTTEVEQFAISATLSDVDSLLENLDHLIAKKRDLKQAAMQQLLTGQVRLPGFSGKWEEKAFGEIASISKGTQLHSSEADPFGHIPHYNGGIEPSSFTAQPNTPANTIAISEGGNSCGFVQYISEPFWCGGHCYAVMPNAIDNEFLFHALKGQQSAIMGLRVGSGLPNIQKSSLETFKLKIPKETTEQTAIAIVLSDMDAELASLEARRDKTRYLKQGMMQELLTGRIRLT